MHLFPSIWGFPKIRGTFFGGPHSKDYRILGSTLGFPLFWETTIYIHIGFRVHRIVQGLGVRTSLLRVSSVEA